MATKNMTKKGAVKRTRKVAKYITDEGGTPFTYREFVRDNSDAPPEPEWLAVMRKLRVGEKLYGGGGAAADFYVQRVK